jgi:hypothetical protein
MKKGESLGFSFLSFLGDKESSTNLTTLTWYMPFLFSNGQAPLRHLASFHRYVINIMKGSDIIVWFFDGSNGA